MYLELLAQGNYININKKLIKLVGINAAIYWSELQNIMLKVVKKRRFDNQGYFTLDRKYMEEQTTLTVEAQQECEISLGKIGVVETNPDNQNEIRVNSEKLVALITSEDTTLLTDIAKVTKKLSKSDSAKAKRAAIKNNMYAALVEADSDILQSLKHWVDSIFEAKKCITKAGVINFQKVLSDYTTNKDTKLTIINIASTHAYIEAAWAIKIYEKDYRTTQNAVKLGAQKINSGGTGEAF